MTTISQPRQHPLATGSIRQRHLATAAVWRARAALAQLTARAPQRTSATAPARTIALRAHRTSAGAPATIGRELRLPR